MEIYLQNQDERCKKLGLSLADAQWDKTTPDGITAEARYWIDDDANLREVCIGTDKGFSEQFYNDRPRTAGDLHGQSPVLWTASALLR